MLSDNNIVVDDKNHHNNIQNIHYNTTLVDDVAGYNNIIGNHTTQCHMHTVQRTSITDVMYTVQQSVTGQWNCYDGSVQHYKIIAAGVHNTST